MERRWWSTPRDTLSSSLARRGMPPTFPCFVYRTSLGNQVWISLLAVMVFVLETAPLEMQRRILNAAMLDHDIGLVVALAVAYAGIVACEGLLKLLMNVYGGWIGERAVRALRLAASKVVAGIPSREQDADVRGVEISMILSEPEPIGTFAGVVVAEIVLHAGILISVFGYMFFINPPLALVCLLVFVPQLAFVPLMQAAINRRVRVRIGVLRKASVGTLLVDGRAAGRAQMARFADIFELNLGILKLRFSMKFLMNLTQNLGRVMVLAVGGWYIAQGRSDVGTVVAFVSGLGKLRDPWSDLVNWYQEATLTSTKYRVFTAAMEKFASHRAPPLRAGALAATPGALRSPIRRSTPFA
jgi:ABC-type bacteriocin/lantibiotic exporter with double-glycine peptidase domain